MRGDVGFLPIFCVRTSVYFEPATPAPLGSIKLTATTAVVTGTVEVERFYELFTDVDGCFFQLATAAGVATMDLTSDMPLPLKTPYRFYSAQFTKVGVKTGDATGSLWITPIKGDDIRW